MSDDIIRPPTPKEIERAVREHRKRVVLGIDGSVDYRITIPTPEVRETAAKKSRFDRIWYRKIGLRIDLEENTPPIRVSGYFERRQKDGVLDQLLTKIEKVPFENWIEFMPFRNPDCWIGRYQMGFKTRMNGVEFLIGRGEVGVIKKRFLGKKRVYVDQYKLNTISDPSVEYGAIVELYSKNGELEFNRIARLERNIESYHALKRADKIDSRDYDLTQRVLGTE